MIPLWPRRALTRLTIAAREPFAPAPRSRGRPPVAPSSPPPLRYIDRRRLGRKKLPRTLTGLFMPSCETMSSVTSRVAVAVNARTGTPPCLSFSPARLR